MSDFKIIGNPNPVVGVLELYTVSDFFERAPSSPFNKENSFSYDPVYWEVYVLEWGRWRKTKENDKSGNKVSYTFLEKSLTRNGIRILVKKGEKVARLDIKPLSAKPKIDHIELLDKNGAKINGRLSYGQTVKARVFCLNMEKQRISVTMWEDDVKGAGHNKANEKNYIETLSGIVKFGKADINFLLKPSFAKIAERGGHEKDKIHEFYVTAEYNDGKIASNNININALETPVAPYKGKTTPQQPVKNKPAAQKPKNDSQNPISSKAVKGKISAVHITDTAGNQIKGIFKEKQIKVWISSTGLAGKDVCLKLYDKDLVSNDLLFIENFTIKSDLHAIVVPLDTIPRSLGGSNWAEGNEQELFAEIEVLQTHDFVKSAVVDVDTTVFKQDPVEVTNKVLKVGGEKEDKTNVNKRECYCNKDFEEKDVRKLVKLLKGSETIWEGQALRGGNRAQCNINDKTFATLTKELNGAFKKYHIDTCIQKIHFLAQVCEETGTFTLSEETKGDFISSQSVYKGRGLLQLTGVKIDLNDPRSHYDKPGPYQDYANYIGDQDIVRKPEVVANNVHYCIDSSGWIWSINKKMTSNPRSQAITKWGNETLGKSLNELAVYEKNYFELISVLLNGRGSNGMPNGYEKRERNYNLLKTFFFKYDSFHKGNSKTFDAQDIVTYHIYASGKIERHIPKAIKSEYKQYYKYIYHDSGGNEHEVCKVKWFEIDKVKIKKPDPSSIPEGYSSNEPFNISGVNQKHVYKYSDGSIVASGEAGEGGGTIKLKYVKSGGKAIIVKVPEPLNYNSQNVKINLSFENTIRKYMGRDQFAALIGALAECGLSLISEGSAMEDGTCFPSVSHTNGESIDSSYFNLENTQKYINAMANFGITTFYYRPGLRLTKPEKATTFREDSHHRAHLHCGVAKIAVTEIKE